MFTFACLRGVAAKCYKWGYAPWLSGMFDTHAACTRAAKADYCGAGATGTTYDTMVDVYDVGLRRSVDASFGLGLKFEAAWSAEGALCINHWRYLELRPPHGGGTCELTAPLMTNQGPRICESWAAAQSENPRVRIGLDSHPTR